jgi:hypothetical protein
VKFPSKIERTRKSENKKKKYEKKFKEKPHQEKYQGNKYIALWVNKQFTNIKKSKRTIWSVEVKTEANELCP